MSTLPSPMLQAIDLTRVNLGAMLLEDLEAHAQRVLDTIGAMNEYINSPAPRSANARLNGLRLANKLRLHMVRVRDVINAHQAALAQVAAARAAGAATMAPSAKPFGI